MTKNKLKDNIIYKSIVIILCATLCIGGKYIPSIGGLSSDAFGVLFVFLGTLILWLTLSMDWPSLLCIFSLSLIDSLGFKNVFISSFGSATLLFLLFTFILTYALSQTSIIKRIAISFINNSIASKGGFYFITLFLSAVLIIGLFMSPSVLFVIMLPILNEIFKIANISKGDKVAKILTLGLGFTVSISSGMTLIAHVFPIIALSAANVEVSQISYMIVAIPTGLLLFIIMLLMFKIFIKIDEDKLKNVDIKSISKNIPSITKKDIIVLSSFIFTILLWIVPSFLKGIDNPFVSYINKYGNALPPLLAIILLSIITIEKKPILNLGEAFKKGVPWVTLLVCAATLAIGSALTNKDIGITQFLEDNLGSSLVGVSEILLLIIFASWAALQTNVSSNMVTATLVATIASSVLSAMDTSLSIKAIALIIGMLASFAFATPPSMPHIALVAGSDYCTTRDVLLYGGLLMIFAIILALLVAYPIGMLIL